MIKLRNISKSFNGLQALSDISTEIPSGGIHAFLGENGAGKSTLMKILSGCYVPDSGQIEINGKTVSFKSTLDGLELEIGMIYQNLTLINSFQIWENFVYVLSAANGKNKFFVNKRLIINKINEFSDKLGFKVDPHRYVSELSEGEKQKIEILKLLISGAKTLILDEPTSLLTPEETESFLRRIRKMSKEGLTVILITHKIREAIEFADNITVLREGKLIASVSAEEKSESELAEMMVGELPEAHTSNKNKKTVDDYVLELNEVDFHSYGRKDLKGISFKIKRGEILGVAGISGEGQGELAKLAAGYYSSNNGNVKWHFSDLSKNISFIPDNPRQEGTIGEFSILDNFLIKSSVFLKSPVISKSFYRDFENRAISLMEQFKISPAKPLMLSRNLSGGNLQKLILARELASGPALLIALYPTKGLDIGAASFVRNKISQLAVEGTAILFFSEDIDELIPLCDRIMVIRDGKIAGLDQVENFNAESIGLLMGSDLMVKDGAAE